MKPRVKSGHKEMTGIIHKGNCIVDRKTMNDFIDQAGGRIEIIYSRDENDRVCFKVTIGPTGGDKCWSVQGVLGENWGQRLFKNTLHRMVRSVRRCIASNFGAKDERGIET